MQRHAARFDVISTLFRISSEFTPGADVISSAVFIGSTAGRRKRKKRRNKGPGTEKAMVVGESKEIVGSLPELGNKTTLPRSGSHARATPLALTLGKRDVSPDTIGFRGVKIFYFNLDNSGIYATPEPVATADYRSLLRFSCFRTHAEQWAERITHMRARVYRDE